MNKHNYSIEWELRTNIINRNGTEQKKKIIDEWNGINSEKKRNKIKEDYKRIFIASKSKSMIKKKRKKYKGENFEIFKIAQFKRTKLKLKW